MHLEVYLEVYLEVVDRMAVDLEGGTMGAETLI